MARVPDFFGQGSETNIASYDYVDIASGTGMIELYCGLATTSNKIMSNIKFYSSHVSTYYATPGIQANWTTALDYDFDILINKPLTIKGNAMVNVPVAAYDPGTQARATCYIRKWDGTTETDIVSGSSDPVIQVGAGSTGWLYGQSATKLVVPQTNFKKGEYLRLTIVLEYKCTSASVFVAIGHDPMNRSVGLSGSWSTSIPTILLFQCPTRIDA
jgi:hypothetical protein